MLHFSDFWVCSEYNSIAWKVDEDEERDGFGSLRLDRNSMDLMQFTGLKDKNGVDVYEDDILRTAKGTLWRVEFDHGGYWVRAVSEDRYVALSSKDFLNWNIEVIGNVYESDLLKS